MSRWHFEVFQILREFAITHTHDGEFEQVFEKTAIDEIVKRIDEAREVPLGPCDEGDLKNLQGILLRNMGQFAPLLAGVYFGRYLQGIENALKSSAEADLVRTMIEGYAFLDERPGHHRAGEFVRYMDRMRNLAASLYSETEGSGSEKDEETEEDHEAL